MAQPNYSGDQDPIMQPRSRTWTDITGKYTTEAELAGFDDVTVRLKKSNGSVVSVPIDKLSQSDRDYLSKNATRHRSVTDGLGGQPKSVPDEPNDRPAEPEAPSPKADDPPSKHGDPPPKSDDPPPKPDPPDKPDTSSIKKPDDRPKQAAAPQGDAGEPKIFVVVNGQKFPKPGLETFFAQSGVGKDPDCGCNPVTGVYCSCHKVCTCHPQCGCVGHKSCSCVGHHSCSCVGHYSGGGGTVTGCRCAPVH